MNLPEIFERTRQKLDLPAPDATSAELAGIGKTFPFSMQTQVKEQWCWAAVSVSVAKFYDAQSQVTQCELVSEEFQPNNCCANPGSDACNQPWYLEFGLSRVKKLASKLESTIAFADVRSELEGERPIGCWIRWPDGTGHFVVLNGYATDFGSSPPAELVSVQDPKYGPSDYDYLKFAVSYRKTGTWMFTYFTQP